MCIRDRPAAVGAVAPGGVVRAVEIDLRAEQRQDPRQQEQHIRQGLPQLRPGLLHEFLFVHPDQTAERGEQQQKQRDRALDVAGDGHGVERGDGEIGDQMCIRDSCSTARLQKWSRAVQSVKKLLFSYFVDRKSNV